VAKAHDLCSNKIDFLFIDGDHSYQAVLSDWLLYFPLVKQGGIVAFHDSHRMYPDVGVPRLLKELEQGKFGICYEINEILHSTEYGISYIIK
jgi:cephalosporin hydroxylase